MKGIILAAGFGSRFLPATKTIPKEMFPLIDTPAIELVVREFAASGIRDILIVTSRRKKVLEDYFDRDVELESAFDQEGSTDKLGLIRPTELNIFFQRQHTMAGTGDALMQVQPFVEGSPFIVAYPDDVLLDGPPIAAQLIEVHERTGLTVLAGQERPHGDISRYGVMELYTDNGSEWVRSVVEKPAPGKEPSRMVAYGRYLYTPDLFDALRNTRGSQSSGQEFTQTDAINELARQRKVTLARITGTLMDVGTPQGYVEAIVESGLRREKFRKPLLEFLRKVVAREQDS